MGLAAAGYSKAFTVTPHDTNAFTPGFPVKALFVGVTGDVTVLPAAPGATSVLFKAVPAGTVLPISVNRVYATGTTATTMLALGD